ncbi:MAG: D-amino acid dehydrogenase [Betaproteobacteria bacterium]
MRIIVLGAGLEGTASAWYLRASGHEVTVLERQPAAGMETSFANGGQISVSHAEPWANPGAPSKVLKWLAREDAPLLFRLRADYHQWRWGLQFLVECLPARSRRNTAALVKLGMYSRASLQALRRETGIRYDELTRGILHLYTEAEEFEAARAPTELMRSLGLDRVLKTPEECVAIEPALAACRDRLAGGTYAASDESGDAHRFTQALAAHAAAKGVEFRYETRIERIEAERGAIAGVSVSRKDSGTGRVTGDAYVLALGSYSPLHSRPLGIPLMIYPAKGYSVTMPVSDAAAAWSVSLTDDEHKLVYSRLGGRLRIAGTAELTGYDLAINTVRCEAIVKRVEDLFPGAGDPSKAEYWTGLRPSTPSNIPYIGRTRYANLFLNTGHGTLGWTHACGSGRALADLMSGRRPEVDFAFCG